jgi:serine protease Do
MTITITPVQRGDVTATGNQKPHRQPGNGGGTTKKSYIGLEVQDLDNSIRRQGQIPDSVQGVIVTSIDPSSPAYAKGLQEGMIIMSINHQDVTGTDDYDTLMAQAESAWQTSHQTVLFKVSVQTQDGWVTQFLAIPFE